MADIIGGDITPVNIATSGTIDTSVYSYKPVINLITQAGLNALTPTIGDRYIITDGINLGRIAEYTNSGWEYITPTNGYTVTNKANDKVYVYDTTSSQWVASGTNLTTDQLGAVTNANNPTALNPFATLDDIAVAGGGDMLKSVYDTDLDGKVNEAEAVEWTGVLNKPSTFTPVPLGQVVTVAKSGGQFTSVAAAMASITDAADDKHYTISIGSGTFSEPLITCKSYVTIRGMTNGATRIIPDGNHNVFNVFVPLVELDNFEIDQVPAGYIGINVDSCGDHLLMHKMSMLQCDIPLKIRATTGDSIVYLEYVDGYGDFDTGIDAETTALSGSIFLNAENFYMIPSTVNSLYGIKAVGSKTTISLPLAGLFGIGSTGTGIYLEDGAFLTTASVKTDGFQYGLRVSNVGAPPIMQAENVIFGENNTYDLYVEHSGLTGSFSGSADKDKIYLPGDIVLAISYNDIDGGKKVVGSFYLGSKHSELTDVTRLITDGSTMGLMEGGVLSVSSGLEIAFSSGFGHCQNDTLTYAPKISWDADTLALPANSDVYVYFTNMNLITYDTAMPNFITNVILGRVKTDATSIVYIDASPYLAVHSANYLNRLNRTAIGALFGEGCQISENVTARKLNITNGKYYLSQNSYTPTGGTAVTLLQHYHSAGNWTYTASDTISNTQYDNGTNLTSLTSGYYVKHAIYIMGEGALEKHFLVYGDAEYATLVEAEEATLPLHPPDFKDSIVLIGSVICRQGTSNIISTFDNRPRIGFTPQGVSASDYHDNLLGRNSETGHDLATADKSGFMPKNDKAKLDNLTATNGLTITSASTGLTFGVATSYGNQFAVSNHSHSNYANASVIITSGASSNYLAANGSYYSVQGGAGGIQSINGQTALAQTITVATTAGLSSVASATNGITFGIATSYSTQFAAAGHTHQAISQINALTNSNINFVGGGIVNIATTTGGSINITAPAFSINGSSNPKTFTYQDGLSQTVNSTGISYGMATSYSTQFANATHTHQAVSQVNGLTNSNINFVGGGIVNIATTTGGSINITAPAFSINGSSNAKTFTFQDGLSQTVNSTGISYGMATSYSGQFALSSHITGVHTAHPLNSLFSGTNISGTMNSTAFALSVAASGNAVKSINGQSADAQTITVATSEGLSAIATATNGITFGLRSDYKNASVVQTSGASTLFLAKDGTYRSVAGGTGGGGFTLNHYEYPFHWNLSCSSHTVVTNSISMQNIKILENLAFNRIDFPMFISGVTTTNTSSRGFTISGYAVIYSSNGVSLEPIAGGSLVRTGSWGSNSTQSFCGYRMLSVPMTTTLTPGNYWLGLGMQTASAVGGNSMSMIVANVSTAFQFQSFGASTVSTRNEGLSFGLVSNSSYNSTNTTITLQQSNIVNSGSQLLRGNIIGLFN